MQFPRKCPCNYCMQLIAWEIGLLHKDLLALFSSNAQRGPCNSSSRNTNHWRRRCFCQSQPTALIRDGGVGTGQFAGEQWIDSIGAEALTQFSNQPIHRRFLLLLHLFLLCRAKSSANVLKKINFPSLLLSELSIPIVCRKARVGRYSYRISDVNIRFGCCNRIAPCSM